MEKFESGAVRGGDVQLRFDLIPPRPIRRLAAIYTEGAEKYGDRNWEKGIPVSNLLKHGLNHLNLWMLGDVSEDNLAKTVWALLAIMYMEDSMPTMVDVPWGRKEGAGGNKG